MNLTELETEALKLDPADRARLAEKLLESLEFLSEQESQEVWLDEAARRDTDFDPSTSRSAEDVLRDVRSHFA